MVVEVGGTRTGQCLLGDRPGIHNEPDTHEARPRPRAHDRNHMAPQVAGHRCVPFDRYGLDRVEPGLIVVQGHPGSFVQAKDKEGVPQVHLRVPVMENGILYNLPNIKRYILYDGVVEQGALGSHFTHIRRRNKT